MAAHALVLARSPMALPRDPARDSPLGRRLAWLRAFFTPAAVVSSMETVLDTMWARSPEDRILTARYYDDRDGNDDEFGLVEKQVRVTTPRPVLDAALEDGLVKKIWGELNVATDYPAPGDEHIVCCTAMVDSIAFAALERQASAYRILECEVDLSRGWVFTVVITFRIRPGRELPEALERAPN